jgi:hypothetical protein
MDAIIFFFVGFLCGWFWHARTMLKRILQNPQEMITLLEKYKVENDKVQTTVGDSIRPVKVEKHGEQFYLYADDNGEFLAQGSSMEEALDIIAKRFPDQNFRGLIPKDQAEKMGLSKQS